MFETVIIIGIVVSLIGLVSGIVRLLTDPGSVKNHDEIVMTKEIPSVFDGVKKK